MLERRIHEFISCAHGIFHMGQRSIIWVRISKEAAAKGFKIKHFGDILVAKMHDEFSRIVDRVQVKIYTEEAKVKELLEGAKKVYSHRDDKIGNMTDEDVEDYYSCTLCQSYAPNHVCIVTPQRLGLCGAYTWLDCKASFQINEHGPNEPVKKGETIDAAKGQWKNINDYIEIKSNGNLKKFNAYSIMEEPMTSCGCFECIAAVVPEANGVMIVDRDFTGHDPHRHDLLHPGRPGGRRPADPRLHRHRQDVRVQPQVHQRRGRAQADRLDEQAAEGGGGRAAEGGAGQGGLPRAVRQDRHRGERRGPGKARGVPAEREPPGPHDGSAARLKAGRRQEEAMALTGMQIYKNLPKTNCKDCGLPTCMAFAMQVAAKQRALTDCPHVTEEAKAAMSEASAPPMRLVKIGPEGSSFDFGQETVLFRHEEKFHRPAGIAVRVPGFPVRRRGGRPPGGDRQAHPSCA